MNFKILIISALFMISLIAQQYYYKHIQEQNITFFGANIDSSYNIHANGIKCAFVKGWHNERKCMCLIINDYSNGIFDLDVWNPIMCK